MKDVNKILDKLEELYPDAKCELDYTTSKAFFVVSADWINWGKKILFVS